MLTLDTLGKTGSQAVDIVRDSLDDNERELKILIDGPSQSEVIIKFLESEGFDVLIEDDEGTLFLMATRKDLDSESESESEPEPEPDSEIEAEDLLFAPLDNKITSHHVIKDSAAVVLSYESKKYMPAFCAKFIDSLAKSKFRPDVIALMNTAVSLAAYNSSTCDALKELESSGVEILISESCADRLGLTESLGAGTLSDMGEIIEKIFSCEKVVSL